MILNLDLMQNYNENSETANSSLLSPTVGVKSIPPNTENSLQHGYDENDNNNMSNETKCETNYKINNKWNNTRHMQLTKRQMIVAEYREKVGHHELQAAHAEEERRLLQGELWRQNWNFVKLVNKVLQKCKNYGNSRVLPSIRSRDENSSRILE